MPAIQEQIRLLRSENTGAVRRDGASVERGAAIERTSTQAAGRATPRSQRLLCRRRSCCCSCSCPDPVMHSRMQKSRDSPNRMSSFDPAGPSGRGGAAFAAWAAALQDLHRAAPGSLVDSVARAASVLRAFPTLATASRRAEALATVERRAAEVRSARICISIRRCAQVHFHSPLPACPRGWPWTHARSGARGRGAINSFQIKCVC